LRRGQRENGRKRRRGEEKAIPSDSTGAEAKPVPTFEGDIDSILSGSTNYTGGRLHRGRVRERSLEKGKEAVRDVRWYVDDRGPINVKGTSGVPRHSQGGLP